MGLKAPIFSIGFGPSIFKKKFGETEFRISVIPLGGYVSLPELDPTGMEIIQGDGKEKVEEVKSEKQKNHCPGYGISYRRGKIPWGI